MAEFTEKNAARVTRRAIAGVKKAIAKLKECGDHWDDLDAMMSEDCYALADLPNDVEQLEEALDDLYPARKPKKGNS